MILSLGEIEALCRKAARGAGFNWGPAEEAGRAVRRLASHGLPGADLLRQRLVAGDGVVAGEFLPVSLEGIWRSDGTMLCPIYAGTSLTDQAAWFADAGELVLDDVMCPLLLVPFAGLAARQIGRTVTVTWDDVLVRDDGESMTLVGSRARLRTERAATVRCRLSAGIAGIGEPVGRVTRAQLQSSCLEQLEAFAYRTYAPATEESRLRGAGGAKTDND